MLKSGGIKGILVAALLCAMALPVAGQSRDALESAFHMENSLLEQESERYALAREQDRQALQRLIELTEQMDQALFDAGVPVSELRTLDGDLNVARETAMERLRASAELRANIFRNLDRLDHLGSEIEMTGDRSLMQTERIDGVWEIEAYSSFAGTYGLMKLNLDGTVISGKYRLSNGHQGSIQGKLVGDQVTLTRTDSQQGDDMWIEGTYDRDAGRVSGSWKSKVLGTGRPEHGEWNAVKISPDEAREVADELGVE